MQYCLRCKISEELALEIKDIVKLLNDNPVKGKYTDQIVNLIVRLSDEALTAFFIVPVVEVKMGQMYEKMAQLGLKTGLSIISKAGKKIINNLSEEQLKQFANFLNSFIWDCKAIK